MSRSSTSNTDVVIGLLFWVLVIGGVLFFVLREHRGEIFLDVSTQPERVSGIVIFEGVPVRDGTLHVVVADARSRRYRAGMTLPVKDGKFSALLQPPLGFADGGRAWRIAAEFHGTAAGGKDETKVVTGDATRYLNTSPPLGERFLWSVAISVAVLLIFQLILFTGDLGSKKARLLFMLMYFFTFFSLALPIAVSLVVAQHEDLMHSMEASPIGLVKAKTMVSSEPQWLVNIGGRVKPAPPTAAGSPDAQTERAVEGDAAGTPGVRTAAAAEPDGASAVPSGGSGEGDAAEPPAAGAATPQETANRSGNEPDKDKMVEGGVAVPFYVVLLAMFGAGINMTLKVPVIQRSYEDVFPEDRTSWLFTSLAAPLKLLRGQTEAPMMSRKTAGDIRRDLIENFMYLLSAPLLAIAVYYLLQVLAEEVTQPVLVLMAFATGLVSKAVIGGIIQFAESRLPGRERDVEPSELAKAITRAQEKQAEAEEAQRAAEEARVNLAAAEAAAHAAQEAAQAASARTTGDGEAARREAEKAAQEAEAKRTEAAEAQEAATRADQRAEETQVEAQQAVSAAEQMQLREIGAAAKAAQEAAAKQAEARDAAEATEKAAKEATAKQAAAQDAVSAAVQPPQDGADGAEARH